MKKPQKDYIDLYLQGKLETDISGYLRGYCENCGYERCEKFRGIDSLIPLNDIDCLTCEDCGCSMSSHSLVEPRINLSGIMEAIMNKTKITDHNIDFTCFVAIYRTNWDFEVGDFKEDIETIEQVLTQGGFQVLSKYDCFQGDILPKIKQRDSLDNDQGITEKDYELLLKKLSKFGQTKSFMQHSFSKGNVFQNALKKTVKDIILEGQRQVVKEKEQYQLETELNIFGKSMAKKLGLAEKTENVMKQLCYKAVEKGMDKTVYVMLLASEYHDYAEVFKKVNRAVSKYMPEGVNLFYKSKSRKQALIDVQVFFPSLFKINIQSFILLPDFNLQGSTKKRYGLLKDNLEFNGYNIVKEVEEKYSKSDLQDFFQKIKIPKWKQLAQLCIQDETFKLMVTTKIGNSLSSGFDCLNLPNHIRVTKKIQNQEIIKEVMSERWINQRIMVIFRPFVISSGLQINLFTILSVPYIYIYLILSSKSWFY